MKFFGFFALIVLISLSGATYSDQQQEDDDAEFFAESNNNYNHQNEIESELERNIENISVKIGQHATLPCFVQNLGSFKVIWSKDGDILTLGTSKINSDVRFNINHRYLNEWHLEIDNVQNEDEGEYVCKTNGNFLKILNLQVLVPPTINDLKSTPAGTIILLENSASTNILKCYADSKPTASIKWYKWKKYKNDASLGFQKEELSGNDKNNNELVVGSIGRNDANAYECVARNSVPPATSRIFHYDIHFLPSVDLKQRKTITQNMRSHVYLDCRIVANPLDRIDWYHNGKLLTTQNEKHEENYEEAKRLDFKIETYDISNLNELFSSLITLTITNLNTFGEFKCCAVNYFGEACSSQIVYDISKDLKKSASYMKPPISENDFFDSVAQPQKPIHKQGHNKYKHHFTKNNDISSTTTVEANILSVELINNTMNSKRTILLNNESTSDLKDKRRHYYIQSKDFFNLDEANYFQNSASNLTRPLFFVLLNLVWLIL